SRSCMDAPKVGTLQSTPQQALQSGCGKLATAPQRWCADYTCGMNEHDYLHHLVRQAEAATELLSNGRKWERERWVCQRLLQALNIAHREEDFTPPEQQPPDVLFREACFEVFFVIDEGRRLSDEWREELARRRAA